MEKAQVRSKYEESIWHFFQNSMIDAVAKYQATTCSPTCGIQHSISADVVEGFLIKAVENETSSTVSIYYYSFVWRVQFCQLGTHISAY